MAEHIFWDRRSGLDRRQLLGGYDINRRQGDRRQRPTNGYVLVVGDGGLDRFELLVILPIIGVMTAFMLGSYLGGL